MIDENELSERAKELLTMPLPQSPCDRCSTDCRWYGCVSRKCYDIMVKPYRDEGIFYIARRMQQRDSLVEKVNQMQEEINKINQEIEEINESLPEFLRVMPERT